MAGLKGPDTSSKGTEGQDLSDRSLRLDRMRAQVVGDKDSALQWYCCLGITLGSVYRQTAAAHWLQCNQTEVHKVNRSDICSWH